jgi:hypothetical protein
LNKKKYPHYFYFLFSISLSSGRHSIDLSESPTKLLIKSRNNSKTHYGEFTSNGAKFNANDRSPNNNNVMSKKMSNGNKFYGDFLTLTPRRNKMNEYLQYQQQSHEPYDHMAGRKQNSNYYQNNGDAHHALDNTEHSYLNSLDTLKLDDDHNILHSKLFYQNDSSGNEYVIQNGNHQKKQHVVTTNVHSSLPNNIVSPPNQFNDSNNINRFIKL